MNYKLVLSLAIIVILINKINCVKLETAFQWKVLEFDWESPEAKSAAIASKRYIPANNLALGMDRWNDKIFLAIPRWRSGVASTVNYITITNTETPTSPLLHPYPSWEANTLPDKVESKSICQTEIGNPKYPEKSNEEFKDSSTIISSFRLRVDECDRLWIIDTGLEDNFSLKRQVLGPSLLIFDLKTDTLIRRHFFSASELNDNSYLGYLTVDSNKTECNKSYGYVSDLKGNALLVYSFEEKLSWRVSHIYFNPDPLSGTFHKFGFDYQWRDGVFSLALGNTKADGSRDVYFHPLISTKEFVVSNKVLQNRNNSLLKVDSSFYGKFKLVGDRGLNGQASGQYLHKDSGIIFFSLFNKHGVGCWNTKSKYNEANVGIIDSDVNTYPFPGDVKVDSNNTLWVLVDNVPMFFYGKLNPDEINYRIMKKNVDEAIADTVCKGGASKNLVSIIVMIMSVFNFCKSIMI